MGTVATFVPMLAMLALVGKFVDFLRYASKFSRHRNAVLTQLIAWVAGIVVVQLFAHSSWADSLPVGDSTLGHLNFWSQLIYGLGFASIASAAADFKRAVDNNDSAAVPPLVEPTTYQPVPSGNQQVTDAGLRRDGTL